MVRMFLVTVLLTAAFGCENEATDDKAQANPASAAAEEGTVYECPMHCKLDGEDEPYTQAEPGQCPVCGMKLKPQSSDE